MVSVQSAGGVTAGDGGTAGRAEGVRRRRELLAQRAARPAPRRILGAGLQGLMMASRPGVPDRAPEGPVLEAPVTLRRNVEAQRLVGRGFTWRSDGRLAVVSVRSGGRAARESQGGVDTRLRT